MRCRAPEEVEHALERGIVELLLIDADQEFDAAADLCSRLKADPFNSVVPIVFFSREHRLDQIATAFERGADEFLSGTQTGREQELRSERCSSVPRATWPSTRRRCCLERKSFSSTSNTASRAARCSRSATLTSIPSRSSTTSTPITGATG